MNFTETLQNLTGKPLADCTNQNLYLALLEVVRQKSANRIQPVTGRKLYYISAEFLIGKLLPITSSIWGCTMKLGMHWPPPARACPTLKNWSRNPLWATAVWAVWPPVSLIRWQP